jgi:transposase
LLLRVGDHERLTGLLRSGSVRSGLAKRARIVLLASEGVRNAEIAERLGVPRPTVNRWRARYVEGGINALADEDRPGRPKIIDARRIVTATLKPPPPSLGVTHWSSRLLAAQLKVNHVTITKAWRQFGVRPWKAETFKFSTAPELAAKVTDVIGLYLRPRAPRGADDLSGGERPSPPDLSQQGR